MDKEAGRMFRCYRKYTFLISAIGLVLSYYSIVVSDAKSADPSYVALCDISKTVSCSDVLTSSYSKGFGVLGYIVGDGNPLYQSNGVYGLLFYVGTIILSLYPAELLAKVQLGGGFLSLVMSCYLGYILIYILEEICIVCMSTYILNCCLFIISVRNYRVVRRLREAAQVPDYSSYLDGKTVKKRV